MPIEATQFGSITVDGHTYCHDVVIRLDATISKRDKNLSRRRYGTSHMLSEEEVKAAYQPGCTCLVVGTGQHGRVQLSEPAALFLQQQRCAVVCEVTPRAIERFNADSEGTIGIFHVTC